MLVGLKPHLVRIQGDDGVDTYTKSLLHFNGQPGSQNFADFSNKVWTAGSYAQLGVVAEAGFSGLDLRAGGWIDTPHHADFDPKTEEFTAECWVYLLNTGTNKYIFGKCDSGAGNISMYCRT